jgi:arginyl-tRNA synthetase
MTQLQGDTGIYLIYTYLRLKNLIKKIDLSLPDSYEPDMSLLTDEEKSMVKNLEKVVYYYILSYQQAKPNFIMSWLFDFMK